MAGFGRESEMKSCKALCIHYCSELLEDEYKGRPLLGNANELQDFISDPHSYPVVLCIPWFHNHYKWGIIL